MKTNRQDRLLRRIRIFTGLFIAGLVLSGLTAIPLEWEVDWLARATGADSVGASGELAAPVRWMQTVRLALVEIGEEHPFLFYGTDWLAFGHIVIAIGFVGAWRDPVRNRWLQ